MSLGQRSEADVRGVMPKAVHIEEQRRSMYSKVIGEKAVWSHVVPEALGLILEHMSSVLHYNAAILTPGQTRLEGLHKFDMNSLHCE